MNTELFSELRNSAPMTERMASDLRVAIEELRGAHERIRKIVQDLNTPRQSLEPFLVRLREEQKARLGWSLWVSAGFCEGDIYDVWPESNMEFFTMKLGSEQWPRSRRVRDLNRRELNELVQWIEKTCAFPNSKELTP